MDIKKWVTDWLAGLPWTEIGTYLGIAIVGAWKVIFPQLSAWTTRKFKRSDPGPTAPMQLPPDAPKVEPGVVVYPPPVLVVTPVDTVKRTKEVVEHMAEWTLTEARARVRELETEVRMLRRQLNDKDRDLDNVALDGSRTARTLAGANLQIERLEQERDQARAEAVRADARARVAQSELAQVKREAGIAHPFADLRGASTSVTPIRPPRMKRDPRSE